MDKNTIGVKLKRLRKKSKHSINEVALMCELSFFEMKDIEDGIAHPSAKTLKILLDLYNISEQDLQSLDFKNPNIVKNIINYIQVVLAALLVLAYALPFAQQFYGPDEIASPLASGYQMLFNDRFGYPNVISILYILFVLQLILHILLYTNLKRFSNVFKIIFLMINIPAVLLFYIDFKRTSYSESTLWILIALLSVHSLLTIYDIVKHPLEHDFKSDKGKMRRWFLLVVNSAYAVTLIWIIMDSIRYPNTIPVSGIIFFSLWTLYLLAYLIIDKALFEVRKNVTFALLIPPATYFIFSVIVLFGDAELFDPGNVFILLFLLLPAFVINIDYFLDLIKEKITKGDTKEI